MKKKLFAVVVVVGLATMPVMSASGGDCNTWSTHSSDSINEPNGGWYGVDGSTLEVVGGTAENGKTYNSNGSTNDGIRGGYAEGGVGNTSFHVSAFAPPDLGGDDDTEDTGAFVCLEVNGESTGFIPVLSPECNPFGGGTGC